MKLAKQIKKGLGACARSIGRSTPLRILKAWANEQEIDNSEGAPGSVRLYETPLGRYYLPCDAPEDPVINSIVSGRIFEPEVVELANTFARAGTTVIDVGANFGQMSVLFSRMVGSAGHVHSFEADPFIFELLKKNLEANHCRNTTAHLGAVYDQSQKTLYYPKQDFKRFQAYGSYGIDPRATAGRTIETITIDQMKITTPVSFMKVDVQGCDLFAMRGAVETISKHKMPILFEFEQQFQSEFRTTFQDYVDFVSSISYRFESIALDINYLILPK